MAVLGLERELIQLFNATRAKEELSQNMVEIGGESHYMTRRMEGSRRFGKYQKFPVGKER